MLSTSSLVVFTFRLFRGAVIHGGGVLPHIESVLMANKPKAKPKSGEKKKARPAKKKANPKESDSE